MELTNFKSIFDLIKAFPSEQSCIDHLEKLRWNGKVVSPFDENSKVYKCKNNRYRCSNTKKYFNVKTGTIFDNTKIPLLKWFLALYVFSSHKKGISSHQLAKDVSITQKSAWFLLHRLRHAFEHPDFKEVAENTIIEIDETFVGGKEKNKHFDKKIKGNKGRSTTTKAVVLGMLQRGNEEKASEVIAVVIPDTQQQSIEPVIKENVAETTTVMTDEWGAYNELHKTYKHMRVNHSAKQYVDGMASTNGIENFWSHLKRGIIGIYHQISRKHLQKYVNEFALRFNSRKDETQVRFNDVLQNISGKRLTYKKLIQVCQ